MSAATCQQYLYNQTLLMLTYWLQLSHYALTNAIICVCLFYLCVCLFFILLFFIIFSFYIAMSFFSFYRVLRVRIHIK